MTRAARVGWMPGWVAVLLVAGLASCTSTSEEAAPSPSGSASPSPAPEPYKAVVHFAVDDIQRFWSQQYPILYGEPYEPIAADHIYAAGDDVQALPRCQETFIPAQQWYDNAFYCYEDNYVAFDARPNGLVPNLLRDYGAVAVAVAFAHEWGHAIQDRADNDLQPTIYSELQADCFAGGWLAHVAAGENERYSLRGGELDQVLAAMITFRDTPGTRAGNAGAHGSGFDRIAAFQEGFDEGVGACVPYFEDPPIVTEIPFTTQKEFRSGGNVAAARVLPSGVELLNDFYSRVERRAYVPIPLSKVFAYDPNDPPATMRSCAGLELDPAQLANNAFICHADRYAVLDTAYLQHIYRDVGDFGVVALLAVPWAIYVQDLKGMPTETTEASLVANCYTGTFSAALVLGRLRSEELGGRVSLSPGDLDEAIIAGLDAEEVRGGGGTDAVFARQEAFRSGFFDGYDACSQYEPSPATATP